MVEFFKKIFASDFLPHGACYLWNPSVLWLNVISDLIITAAYYVIPILLFVFLRKRKDFTLNWIVGHSRSSSWRAAQRTFWSSGRYGMPHTGWTEW